MPRPPPPPEEEAEDDGYPELGGAVAASATSLAYKRLAAGGMDEAEAALAIAQRFLGSSIGDHFTDEASGAARPRPFALSEATAGATSDHTAGRLVMVNASASSVTDADLLRLVSQRHPLAVLLLSHNRLVSPNFSSGLQADSNLCPSLLVVLELQFNAGLVRLDGGGGGDDDDGLDWAAQCTALRSTRTLRMLLCQDRKICSFSNLVF